MRVTGVERVERALVDDAGRPTTMPSGMPVVFAAKYAHIDGPPPTATPARPKIAQSPVTAARRPAGIRIGMTATGTSKQNSTGSSTRPCMKSPPTRSE